MARRLGCCLSVLAIRAAALSTRSAESISLAAQSFDQDDDITVLTLRREVPA
jgi:hypothetical protein